VDGCDAVGDRDAGRSAAAAAADTFADASRPNDLGDCLTPATACKTINAAIAKAGDAGTVHVEGGMYAENVVSNGTSIVADAGTPTLSPTSGVALEDTGGPGATIQGLTFSSNVATPTS